MKGEVGGLFGGVVVLVFLGLGIVERQRRKACKRIQDLNMVKLRK